MPATTTIEIDRVIGASPLAIHVRIAGDCDVWIPRSLILEGSEYEEPPKDDYSRRPVDDREDGGSLILPTWFVEKEELPCD